MKLLRQLFYCITAVVTGMLASCHNVEEPKPFVKMGGGIDEDELKAIHILYDSLKLGYIGLYKNWVRYDFPGYTDYYTPYEDPFVMHRYGLVFEPDSVKSTYHVTEINLYFLPDRDDIRLPDVFDKFKHLKELTLGIPSNVNDMTLPPSLCECPLTTLLISGNKLSGSLPANFVKLANTLQYLSIRSHYGNDLLSIIPQFTNLKEASLRHNDFSGKTPYYPNCTTLFDFSCNNFTEFDWRYIEDYTTFVEVFNSKKELLLVPSFTFNMIDGTLPAYFNEGFFDLYKKQATKLELFMAHIFGHNPIFNVYDAAQYKYWGRHSTEYIYKP